MRGRLKMDAALWRHSAESHYVVGNSMGEAMVKLLKVT